MKQAASAYHTIHSSDDFDLIRQRFYEVTGTRNIYELADVLHTTPSRISDARRRLRIPETWFRVIFLKTRTDPDWLRHGMGQRAYPLPHCCRA